MSFLSICSDASLSTVAIASISNLPVTLGNVFLRLVATVLVANGDSPLGLKVEASESFLSPTLSPEGGTPLKVKDAFELPFLPLRMDNKRAAEDMDPIF